MLNRQRRSYYLTIFLLVVLCRDYARADAYDPPPTYYSAATGTGATLKSQLNTIIKTGFTSLSYNSADTNLQITDADPNAPGHMLTAYDRTSVNVAAINPGGPIPGWDSGGTWNKEHTWPQSRQVGSSGPDYSDLFELRPTLTANNGNRGNANYGGAYGAQGDGLVSDGGTKYYPGDADAGMIAREEFYMAVRYDGTETATSDLELFNGDPTTAQGLGDLNRLIEWNYAAPPDLFERKRNQIIYDQFQHNRDPFTDHPEYVWSVFVNQTNNSQISIAGSTVNANGSSTRNIDMGRVFVNAAVPAAQAFTLNKSGTNGTYFGVTTSGAATSSLSGRFNNMRTNQTDSKLISVGLNTTTTAAGLKSGTVTIDNLDVTTGGGTGHGANDANDTFNVSLTVLDHSTPSFASSSALPSLTHDFGIVPIGVGSPAFTFDIYNLLATASYTANMDFDSVVPGGNSSAFTTDLAASAGSLVLAGGTGHTFTSSLTATSLGTFSASYSLNFSDEDISGALNKSMTLTLIGKTLLAGDYNGDSVVNAADYIAWRNSERQPVTAYSSADGNGDGVIDNADYDVWRTNFGLTAAGSGAGLATATIPEPASALLLLIASMALVPRRAERPAA
jgi:endonuclease I